MSVRYFSAPGRVEIGGNHTDHQHGRVLAAAIDLEATASVEANGSNAARLFGEGVCADEIDLNGLDVREDEKGTSAALVRGVAAWFVRNGHTVGGFDAEVSSNIPIGEGLSSSAAFEVLIGNIFKGLFGASVTPVDIAKAGQYAENVYFGKPCGLMDQTASSFGGLNIIDFRNPEEPIVTPVNAVLNDFDVCVTATGASHADLTDDYAACAEEMRSVAECFGKGFLAQMHADEFFSSIGRLRHLGDRAILRAIHFFGENERVSAQADMLERGKTQEFLELVIESGRSSLAYLQNVFSPADHRQQGLTLALALSERVLAGKGAWRVHGGGFAGSILAFVPRDMRAEYDFTMSSVFGENCCRFLKIREEGGGENAFSR